MSLEAQGARRSPAAACRDPELILYIHIERTGVPVSKDKDFSFDDDDDDKPIRRPKGRRDDDDDEPKRRPKGRRDDEEYDDDDDPPPRRSASRRAPAKAKSWVAPFRFVTPGTFGMAVLFFFLPWSDLNCSGPTGRMQLITQSGFQSALGEYSEGSALDEMRDENKGKGKQGGMFNIDEMKKNPRGAAPGGKGNAKDDGPPKAYLLWVYLLVLLAGAVVPVLLGAHQLRGGLVMGFVAFALLLIIVQAVIGFPLATTANDFNADMKKEGDMNLFGPPGKGGGPVMRSSFLPSFYLTILILLLSGGLGLLQLIAGGTKAAPKRRHRDEDDEDDDPPPKKRRRDDDDEDDEPAPKRRRRRDEDD